MPEPRNPGDSGIPGPVQTRCPRRVGVEMIPGMHPTPTLLVRTDAVSVPVQQQLSSRGGSLRVLR